MCLITYTDKHHLRKQKTKIKIAIQFLPLYQISIYLLS